MRNVVIVTTVSFIHHTYAVVFRKVDVDSVVETVVAHYSSMVLKLALYLGVKSHVQSLHIRECTRKFLTTVNGFDKWLEFNKIIDEIVIATVNVIVSLSMTIEIFGRQFINCLLNTQLLSLITQRIFLW